MSLGDNYNKGNQDNNKKYESPVYSNYNMSNPYSEIDSTSLSTSFSGKLLKISIQPRIADSPLEKPQWDRKGGVSIFLTHTKARMLLNEIIEFEKDPTLYSNVGVNSGAGLISISNGRELGANNVCIIIRKLDAGTGEVESSFAYEIKQNYHYSIRNFNQDDLEYDKIYHNNLELDQLKTLLHTYVEAMTNAMAYSLMDNIKYDHSRMNTKLDSVCEKLGVEYKKDGSNEKKSNGNIFDKKEPRNTSFNSGTIDDIMGI